MKSKQLFLIFSLPLFFLLFVIPTDAYFTKSHEYWVLKAIEDEPDSMVAKLCGDRPEFLTSGNTINDVPVLHYNDRDQVKSYIFLHQRQSYIKCLNEAGTDVNKKCLCYGGHNIGDGLAHLDDGIVVKYLKKYLGSNLLYHAAIESDYEKKHMKYLEKKGDSLITSGKLEFYDDRVLDVFFEETGGNSEYLEIYSRLSGLSFDEFKRDAQIFRSGYQGEGFYSTIYDEKITLPSIFYIFAIGLMVLGLGSIIIILVLGIKFPTTKWKYLFILLSLIVLFIGSMLLISLITGNTWDWIRLSLTLVPIKISDADVALYDDLNLKDHKEFFRTGVMPDDDVSGLSFYDSEGRFHEGALSNAEKPFNYLMIFVIAPLVLLFYTFLLYKIFKVKKKEKSTVNKVMNFLGWMYLILFILLFIGWTLLMVLG
jgi:hypothetical protein